MIAASANAMPMRSPATIWSLAPSETANPNFCAEKICSATWRNAWTHSSGASASARFRAASQGATYQTAIIMKMTKFRTLASAAAKVRVMKLPGDAIETDDSGFLQPIEGVFSFGKPGGRKDRRSFEHLFAPGLHCAREPGRDVKSKFRRAGRAV